MMSIHFFGLVLLFFKFHHNFCNSNIDNFFKGYVKCNNFSTNKFLTSNSYIYGEFSSVAIFITPHTNVLSSSTHFYHFSSSFYENSFFKNSTFYNIFNVNSVTNILNNDYYITYLFDRDKKFLFCNYKVTGECINIFHQIKNKFNASKISIISDNNAFFLVIIIVIFRVLLTENEESTESYVISLFFEL